MKNSLMSFAFLSSLTMSVGAFAQTATTPAAPLDPGHPRVSEVDQRIDNQQNRVNQGVDAGTINAAQAARDDNKLNREQKSLNKDVAANGGHITKGEDKSLNKRLNKGSRKIHRQKKNAAATATPSAQ